MVNTDNLEIGQYVYLRLLPEMREREYRPAEIGDKLRRGEFVKFKYTEYDDFEAYFGTLFNNIILLRTWVELASPEHWTLTTSSGGDAKVGLLEELLPVISDLPESDDWKLVQIGSNAVINNGKQPCET